MTEAVFPFNRRMFEKCCLALAEPEIDPALLQDCVCSMLGLDLGIDRHMAVRDRAMLDVVVTFTPPDKGALILQKDLTYQFLYSALP